VVDIREPVTTRLATPRIPERRTVSYRFISTLRSFSMPRSLVSGRSKLIKIEFSGQGPRENETRKWRRRQNGRVTDGIAYVVHKIKMGNLTDTRSCLQGMASAPFPLLVFRDNDTTSTTTKDNNCTARVPESAWISQSRVDNGVNSARRGARMRGQSRHYTISRRPATMPTYRGS